MSVNLREILERSIKTSEETIEKMKAWSEDRKMHDFEAKIISSFNAQIIKATAQLAKLEEDEEDGND